MLACLPAHAMDTPKDFKAIYKASFSGFDIKAVSQLSTLESGQKELRFEAKSWIAGIEEFSRFDWGQEGLIPARYEYHRTGLGRERHAILTFDWAENNVTNNVQSKPWSMSVPDGSLDKLSAQLQLRLDLINQKALNDYQIADGGKLKTYTFEVLGEEIIETRLGKLNTVKVLRRQKTNSKRSTTLWLARDWDYIMVRLHREEKDGKHYKIDVDSATVAQTIVTGIP